MAPRHHSLLVAVALVVGVGAASQWWSFTSERRLGAQLAAAARAGDIRMLSSDTCVYCGAARRWLNQHSVGFDECFIERDAQCRALYEATQARGTPTLIVRGKVQLGFDAERVLAALAPLGR
jgi:glutaredoxin